MGIHLDALEKNAVWMVDDRYISILYTCLSSKAASHLTGTHDQNLEASPKNYHDSSFDGEICHCQSRHVALHMGFP